MKTFSFHFFIVMLAGLLMVACQQPYYGSGNVGVKDHSDSVVNINQVDPAYRRYFADQHDSNYSLQDQRKAFFEAVKTAKTPVQQDARHMSKNAPKQKASKKSSKSSKKTSRPSKKKVVKRKTSSKSTKTTTKRKKR